MRCPEQNGSDVVAEISQTMLDHATKLIIIDKDQNTLESIRHEGGKSPGLVRYVHRFKNLNINNVDHLEFQKRPYDYWITF